MFVLSFTNGQDDSTRNYFDEYYMPLVEIKAFNALNDNKPFFDQPMKSKREAYKKLIGMSRNDDYTIGNLWDYLYHQKYYKLIGIDLSRQTNMRFLQQINFVEELEKDYRATMFFYRWKAAKNCSKLFFRFINCNRII